MTKARAQNEILPVSADCVAIGRTGGNDWRKGGRNTSCCRERKGRCKGRGGSNGAAPGTEQRPAYFQERNVGNVSRTQAP